MTLNNHTVAAEAAMVALFAAQRILDRDQKSIGPYLLCGLMSAWTAVNELPAASLAGLLFLLALRQSMIKTLLGYVPAAAIPVIAFFAANQIATGTWKPLYANYGTEQYRFVVDGIPSYWMNPQGVDKNLDDPATYLMHCLIGHHGIFSLTPIALCALLGWLTCVRSKGRSQNPLMLTGLVTFVVVIGFYLTRTQNYNYGGVSCGLRWAVWLIPLWLVAAVPIFDWCAKTRLTRSVLLVLFSISMYSAWSPIDNPWRQPWIFQWMEARGWIDYSDPIPELPRPLWTWFSSLPDPVDGQPAWVEFRIEQPSVAPRFVRLTGPRVPPGPTEPYVLEVQQTGSDGTIKKHRIECDRGSFLAGGAPAEVLRWSDPAVTPELQQSDLAFVRGIPRKVPYHIRAVRYLKTPLQKNAFSCQLVAAHVAFSTNDSASPLVYRCDSWLTDNVPFGTAQVDFHVSPHESPLVTLFHERWTVHDCWPGPKTAPTQQVESKDPAQ